MRPASTEVTYVLASTEHLCSSVIQLLWSQLYEVVDVEDRVLGLATKEQIRERGEWRRMVHVFIFDQHGKLFIVRRKRDALAYAGLWTSRLADMLK
jgi:hypothetical protein